MRVTQSMIVDTTWRNLNANLARIETYRNELSSGVRISTPSDDPIGAVAAMTHRASLDQLEQHLKNIDEATAWMNVTDSIFNTTGEALRRSYELALSGASDTLSAQDRLAVKAEIDIIADTMLSLTNSKYGDEYIFSGTRTTTAAYVAGTPPTYAGNSSLSQREIAPGVNITANTLGQPVFDPIFAALNSLSTALGANNSAGIQAGLNALQGAEATLLNARAQLGARLNRLTIQQERLLDTQIQLAELRSKVEDADFARTTLNLSTAETVYKAALQTSARSLQSSLLDYLR